MSLQEITSKIEGAQAMFSEWNHRHAANLSKVQERISTDASTSEDAIKKLYKEEQENLKAAKKVAMSHGVEHEKLSEKDQEIADLQRRMQSLPGILQEQNATIEAEEKNLADQRNILIKTEKEATHNMTEKRVGQQTFQERLGLRFERVEDDHLRVVFNNIDVQDPAKDFWFAVQIDEDNVYQFGNTSCKPYVEELPDMLSNLNETNDFGSFVRQMRTKFVELA